MEITENDVQHYADIAQISLSEDEIVGLSDNMNRIIAYIKAKLDEVEKLNEFDNY